jgi:hypothetical protein
MHPESRKGKKRVGNKNIRLWMTFPFVPIGGRLFYGGYILQKSPGMEVVEEVIR